MKLFLVGASGMIGSRILAEAVARGHSVIAAARDASKIAGLEGVTPVALDASNAAALRAQAEKADVYISAFSPRSTGDARAEAAKLGAALVEAAEKAGKRVMLVGGAGTLKQADGSPVMDSLPDFIRPEAEGIRSILDALRKTGLDWTYFAPAALIEPGTRTGVFRRGGDTIITDAEGNSRISAEDFAVALLDEIEQPAYSRQVTTVGY